MARPKSVKIKMESTKGTASPDMVGLKIYPEQTKEVGKTLGEFIREHYSDEFILPVKQILLSLVDALHDKDNDDATWKPIRDAIEGL